MLNVALVAAATTSMSRLTTSCKVANSVIKSRPQTIIAIFEVTCEDISLACRNSKNGNPIAVAARRSFPGAFDVHVARSYDSQSGAWWTLSIQSFHAHLSYSLPEDIVEKMQRYD